MLDNPKHEYIVPELEFLHTKGTKAKSCELQDGTVEPERMVGQAYKFYWLGHC